MKEKKGVVEVEEELTFDQLKKLLSSPEMMQALNERRAQSASAGNGGDDDAAET